MAESTVSTPVPAEFVDDSPVRPRAWRPEGADRFVVTCSGADDRAPVLLAHAVRQAGLVVAYCGYRLPADHRVVLGELNYAVDADEPPDVDDLTLCVACPEVERRRGGLWGLHYEIELTSAGRTIGRGSARLRFLSPAVYRFARRSAQPSTVDDAGQHGAEAGVPVPADRAGCARGQDVLLAETGLPDTWRLRVPPDRLRVFGAPADHVPGMVLVEAARQAVLARRHPVPFAPQRFASTFVRYAEPGPAILVRVLEDDAGALRVLIIQRDDKLFQARIDGKADRTIAVPREPASGKEVR